MGGAPVVSAEGPASVHERSQGCSSVGYEFGVLRPPDMNVAIRRE